MAIFSLTTCREETYHSAKSDETDQRILRQKAKAHDERLLERGQTVLLLAHVHDIEKDGRGRSRAGKAVFDRRVAGMEFGGDGICGDILVVRGKLVPGEAERADPDTGPNIDLAIKDYQQKFAMLAMSS